jgi:transcriptional regulator with XRE-family HTH domain
LTALSERDHESVSLFVDEMKAAREQRGWSQAELGKQAGYSESLIAMVEGFHRMPTPELVKALDRAFGTPGFSEGSAGMPGTPGTFGRLERRLRDLPFPAAFRSFAPYETSRAVASPRTPRPWPRSRSTLTPSAVRHCPRGPHGPSWRAWRNDGRKRHRELA